jgi:hypothetical protein
MLPAKKQHVACKKPVGITLNNDSSTLSVKKQDVASRKPVGITF